MSRYLILVLLNLPIVLSGILDSLVNFKTRKISRRKFIVQFLFFLIAILLISLTKFIYDILFSNKLTNTEPLSLFDVIQLTTINYLFLLTFRIRNKISILDKKLSTLHKELSLKNSKP